MPRLLSQLIDKAVQRAPESPAVRCNGETLTYEQLASRAYGLARLLQESGLEPRDRVGVLLPKSLQVPVAFYGVVAAGATLVPIDPKSPAEQELRILRATGAKRLITEPGRQRVVEQVLASGLELTQIIGLEAETESGAASPPDTLSWTTVLEAATDQPPPATVIDTDPVYVLHTSGSTGIPKLIQHSHRSALSFVDWAASEYDLTADDRLTNHSSHHTCFATFDYYAAARAGACTVLLTPSLMMMPASLASLLEKEAVSVWYSVPTALVQLSLRGNLETHDLRLRWVLFAGETFPEKHLRRLMTQLPEARFSHVYGSTEVNVCTYYHLPTAGDSADSLRVPLPIGRACSNSSTLVVDDQLQPVADGGVGELWVRGSTLMSGYWGEPERNRQVLVKQPADGGLEDVYFRTGDRVRRLDDGNLTFVERADLQVKVRGFRVELGEVETALLALDAVEEAAAIAVPDTEGSSKILAAVVVGPKYASALPEGKTVGDASQTAGQGAQLTAELKKTLPLHAVPSAMSVLPSLPRTPTGKVDRKALRGQLEQE